MKYLPDLEDFDKDAWFLLGLTTTGFVIFMVGIVLDWGPICHHASMGVC